VRLAHPLHPPGAVLRRLRTSALRAALSPHVTIGLSAALGLALISALMQVLMGPAAAAAAAVGVIVAIPPDQPAPRHRKFWQLVPGVVLGVPLFYAVQRLHDDPLHLALLLVPASFCAFLGAAWGKRGLPVSVSVMFAMIFSMAVPASASGQTALLMTAHFAAGAVGYVLWATVANAALNPRYRALMVTDTLYASARLMRSMAAQFVPAAAGVASPGGAPLVGQQLREQAALADQLQATRDIVLESPSTPRRQRLAGMLVQLLELRDHLVACELDLDTVKAQPAQMPALQALSAELRTLAERMDHLADALLLGRLPLPFVEHRHRPVPVDAAPSAGDTPQAAGLPRPEILARGLIDRVGHIHDEVGRITALARGDREPDLAVVRATWQMFISPTRWSWRPFLGLWRWDAPPLRHAIRAALAIAAGLLVGWLLPWGTHDYWILLTIVVVLRGSLAQTLERRNSRVAGTLLGCVLAGLLLAAHLPAVALLVLVALAQGIAHAFALKRYLVTAVAATVLALLQAHQLNAAASPTFEALERVADTLLGVGLAWAFSYVLPSWERTQIPALVKRTLAAQAQHAQVALGLGQLRAVDNESELGWRLARREVYDSLSALVQATQRSLAEPRAVRPPLEPLSRLLGHSYQLLAQLTAVKTMLLLRRGRLTPAQIQRPLQEAAALIAGTLASDAAASPPADTTATAPAGGPVELPDPFVHDLSPWLVRRLHLAGGLAQQLRADAGDVLRPPPL